MSDRVVQRFPCDVVWPFGRDPYVEAMYQAVVDPFPCYAHDYGLVVETLEHVEGIVDGRVMCLPTIYVLHNETTARTNGWAQVQRRYPKPPEGESPWEGEIVLSGKRIPIHPAMTRYVIAHEYGHHAEFELLRRRGKESHADDLKREYAELRSSVPPVPYGGGNWHATVGEMLADDFRILVCGVETEFWPHPGFAHPRELPLVQRWWRESF